MTITRVSVFAPDDAIYVGHATVFRPNLVWISVKMDAASPIQGTFDIGTPAEKQLQQLAPQERARLGTMFLDMQTKGKLPGQISLEHIEEARTQPPLPFSTRANRLLRRLHDEAPQIGQMIEYEWNGTSARGPLVCSESVDRVELRFLLDHLAQRGLIDVDYSSGLFLARVTGEGLALVDEQTAAQDSSQAFVAMWFDESMNSLYNDGIAPGIEDAGYEPLRVDRQPSLHRIDDQIAAEIRRSRFVVADFTHDERGARGSVYYEAGYAHGLGIPVIFTCRQDQLDDLHFDTRQHFHIDWTQPADLRQPLGQRIEALIGRGPNAVACS